METGIGFVWKFYARESQ